MRGRKPIFAEKMKKVHILLPESFAEGLKDAAEKRQLSVAKLVRKVLVVFLRAEVKRLERTGAPVRVPDGDEW